jgi:subtilisin-like proprotein convertase family protein
LADDATLDLPGSFADNLIDRAYRPTNYEDGFSEDFSNDEVGPLTIPTTGTANFYPSSASISFNDLGGVKEVEVHLYHVNHTYPDDLDVLLVGPTGQKVILMSDVGGGNDLANVDLTFSSTALNLLPDNGVIGNGVYRPTDYEGGDSFPSAPAGPYSTDLAVFNGEDPNGVWQLYIRDDTSPDAGVIEKWSLSIIVDDDFFPAPAPAKPYSATLAAFNGLNPNGLWKLFVVDDTGGLPGGGSVGGWKLHLKTFVKEQITLSDVLPPGMRYSGYTGAGWRCSSASGVVNCSRSDATPTNPVPILQLKMKAPATAGGITNTAIITSNLPGLPAQNAIAPTLVKAGLDAMKKAYLPLVVKKN